VNQVLRHAHTSSHEEQDSEVKNSTPPVSNPTQKQTTELTDAPELNFPAQAWSEALTCEARNSLQVVLSGMEILLEDPTKNLQTHQKVLLNKVMDNAYHLCHLISLLGPEEFKLEQMSLDEMERIRQGTGGCF